MGGMALASKYGSIQDLLSAIYPDFDWLPWRFKTVPNKYWENMDNCKKFMEWAGKELQIKEMSNWYKIVKKVKKIAVKIIK